MFKTKVAKLRKDVDFYVERCISYQNKIQALKTMHEAEIEDLTRRKDAQYSPNILLLKRFVKVYEAKDPSLMASVYTDVKTF